MGGAGGGVVAMGPEVPAIGGVVAADQVALHAGGLELEGLGHLGSQAVADAAGDGLAQGGVGQFMVAALLVARVEDQPGLAVNVAHEARGLAAVGLVGVDQPAAQGRLEHPGQDQHRRVQRRAGVVADLGRGGDEVEHGAGLGDRRVEHAAQLRIQHQPEGAIGHLTGGLGRRRAVQAADGQVMVPEPAQAGQAFDDPALGLVGRIDADPEERSLEVVEDRPPPRHLGQGRRRQWMLGRAQEAQGDVAPGGRVEGEAGIGGRTRREPRRGLADAGAGRGGGGGVSRISHPVAEVPSRVAACA